LAMSMPQHTGEIAHEEKEVSRVAHHSDEVIEFCQRHAIENYLTNAEELATRLFPHVVRISVVREQDPEDGDQYLVMDVFARGDEDECFNAHKNYLSIWANSVAWPEVRLIRLTYNAV
jgi:hypothetical protein